MKDKFTPFADKYKHLSDEVVFGNKEFASDGDESNISNETKFFEEQLPLWVAYYRKFPHKLVEDYFGIKLKPFQIYILYTILNKPNTLIIASRGLGKTFIVAVASLCKAILYSGTKIVVVAGVKGQAFQTLSKIKEIRGMSQADLLQFEITEFRENPNTQQDNVEFASGSTMNVVPASDNARGYRSHFSIYDEYRMIDDTIYKSVLRRFLTTPRSPQYLNNPLYKRFIGKERNQEVFMSSAWYKNTWAYSKYKTFFNNLVKYGVKSTYGLLSFSYEVSIMNGLLSKEQLLEELQEEDFDFSTFAMELKSFWSGEITNGYYTYDKLLGCRTIEYTEYPEMLQKETSDKNFIFEKHKGEIRIISADIAIMGGKKNDNTILTYICAYPNKTNQYYIRELRYLEVVSGGVDIDKHAVRIREMFDEFECDYIVLDTNGIGMTVYGDLIREIKRAGTSEMYEPLGCMNDEEMQKLVPEEYRHTVPKVIYSVKASQEMNKDMNSNLQSKIIRKHLRLLVDENQADSMLAENKKYADWRKGSGNMFKALINPYKETTRLINELINLELVDQEKIKLKEKSGQRKDRFSSLVMGNFFISKEFESKLMNKRAFSWEDYCGISTRSNGYKAEAY